MRSFKPEKNNFVADGHPVKKLHKASPRIYSESNSGRRSELFIGNRYLPIFIKNIFLRPLYLERVHLFGQRVGGKTP